MSAIRPFTNDNVFSRQLYQGEMECLHHIPAARYLISKYVAAYWKHDPDDLDYVHMELTICRYLLMETRSVLSRTLKIKWLARVLDIKPIQLYNDPSLPF
jgi:hypothetical protein